jgi:hypothetical protein
VNNANREMVMRPKLPLLLGLLLAAACAGDPTFSDRPPPEGGIIVGPGVGFDADPISEGGEPCPGSEPKLGDRCPSTFSEGDTCTYEVGTCMAPNGSVYPEFNNYCCQGTLWVGCGGMSACDAFDAAVPDARAVADAPGAVDADAQLVDAAPIDADPDAGAPD